MILAERLRTETRALHTAAERSPFMATLLRGRMSLAAYVALLRNLHPVYAALEDGLARNATHPVIAPVYTSDLDRRSAIENDLDALHGPGWQTAVAVQPAASAYVARLGEIETLDAGLLLAHAYVRYLGDLSGGQALRGIVARMPWSRAADATAMYEFGDEQQTRALTERVRDGLAAVRVVPAVEQAIVDEAVRSFEAHIELFRELAEAEGPVI